MTSKWIVEVHWLTWKIMKIKHYFQCFLYLLTMLRVYVQIMLQSVLAQMCVFVMWIWNIRLKYRRGNNVNEASFFFGYLLKIIHSSSQRRVAEDSYHSFLHFTYVRKLNSFCISFYFHCSINLHVPLCW